MKFKKAQGLIPRFLKRRFPENSVEVDLTNPSNLDNLGPKIKFLAGQLLRFDTGVNLLRYNFSLSAEGQAIPFVAKNQSNEAIFAWHFKKLEGETFLKLFTQFEAIQKNIKSICSPLKEFQSLEKLAPKFWIIAQEVSSELESLLPYLKGINFELFKLKIARKGTSAIVSIQKLVHTSLESLKRNESQARLSTPLKSNLHQSLLPKAPVPQVESLKQFSSLLDAQQLDKLPKIKAVKKPVTFKKATITQEEMRDFLSMDEGDLSEEDDVTDPFISLENLRDQTRKLERNPSALRRS